MKPLRAWILRLAGMLPNERRERELADEIETDAFLAATRRLREKKG